MAIPFQRAFKYLLVLYALAIGSPAAAQGVPGLVETPVLSPWSAQAYQALGPSNSAVTLRRMGAQEWVVWDHEPDEQYLPKCSWSRGVKQVVVIHRFVSVEDAQADIRYQIQSRVTRRHDVQVDMRGLAGASEGVYFESHDQQQPCGLWGERITEFRVGNFNVHVWEVPNSRPLPDLGFVHKLIALAGELARGYPPGAGARAADPVAQLGPQPGQPIITIEAANPAQNSLTLRIEPVKPAPPMLTPNDFAPAFGTVAAQAARSAEDHVFVHVDYIGPDGRPVMAASPYITDGVINAAETSARLSVVAAEAGANWVSKNPEAAAGLAVATAVSMLVPAAPIAAYVLGVSGEAAVVGTAAEAMIGGVIASGTEAFVTTTLKEIGSDRSVGDKLRNIAGATGASALTSIPSSVVGANMTTILGQFVAQKTAGVVGSAAGKGVDIAIGALGVSDAAQQALTGQMPTDRPPIKSGGVIVTALSPQSGFK